MAKYWGSQTQNEIMDGCLQLHGGYGFIMEYPILVDGVMENYNIIQNHLEKKQNLTLQKIFLLKMDI